MSEIVGQCRVIMRTGTVYIVTEPIDDIIAEMQGWLTLTSVTGAFPPERLHVSAEEIAALQEVAPESWEFTARASTLHYMRQIEARPDERVAVAAEALAGRRRWRRKESS